MAMKGESSLDPSSLWVFSLQRAQVTISYKTTDFSGCSQGPDHQIPPPRVDGSLNDSQHGLVLAEQVQLKGLGLWNFKKGTNTNIPEIN